METKTAWLRTAVGLVVAIVAQTASADIITFSPVLDFDNQMNNSSLASPYDANNPLQSRARSGIVDDGSTSYSDIYFFRDASTGIEFSFSVTWDAALGINPGTSVVGVGTNSTFELGESMTISLSELNVDLSNYIDGSVNGISNPTLASSSLAFRQINFNNFDATTIVDISSPSTTIEFQESDGSSEFDLPEDGLTDAETMLTFQRNDASTDTEFSISAGQFTITADLRTTAAVPEPSSMLLVILASTAAVSFHRQRHKTTPAA